MVYTILQEVCACYWPHSGASSFDDVNVELIGGNTAKHFTTRTLKITDNKVRLQIRTLVIKHRDLHTCIQIEPQ